MRPGFANLIKDSRNHQGGRIQDENFMMKDMDDAEGWDQLYTNTIREVGNLGTVRDWPEGDTPTPTKLTSHCFGLHLTINTDWYTFISLSIYYH